MKKKWAHIIQHIIWAYRSCILTWKFLHDCRCSDPAVGWYCRWQWHWPGHLGGGGDGVLQVNSPVCPHHSSINMGTNHYLATMASIYYIDNMVSCWFKQYPIVNIMIDWFCTEGCSMKKKYSLLPIFKFRFPSPVFNLISFFYF